MNNIKPDDLLRNIGRSTMGRAVFCSIAAHIVLAGATSLPLFRDWQTYGVKSPSSINAIKKREAQEAAEAARRKAAEEKAEAKARAEAEEAAKAAEQAKKNPPEKAETPAAAAAEAGSGDGAKAGPPEVQPLPPKKEFEYGDDLSLD